MGTLDTNGLGLFDLHGNVWEWCEDGFDQDSYADPARVDPTGHVPAVDAFGDHKVCRGGSALALAEMCRTRYRFHEPAGFHAADLGFRVASGDGATWLS